MNETVEAINGLGLTLQEVADASNCTIWDVRRYLTGELTEKKRPKVEEGVKAIVRQRSETLLRLVQSAA